MDVMATPPTANPFSPNYSFVFDFETDFDHRLGAQWMSRHWKTSFYWVFAYLVLVFGGQHLMASRKPFRLRTALVLWNVSLALFSICGTLRTAPELVHVIRRFGFRWSVCDNSFHTRNAVSSFWTFAFIVSKVPELGDTLFVVLRKQRLLFLHYYHHCTVLLFTWYSYADEASAGRWYIDMNYAVHALMYSYYAVRALGARPPRPVAMAITGAQILQMLFGTYVTVYALNAKLSSGDCRISLSTVYAGIVMYLSYFVLFANFFVNSYLKRSPNTSKDNTSTNGVKKSQ